MQQPFCEGKESLEKRTKAPLCVSGIEGIFENTLLLGAAPVLRAFSCGGTVFQSSS